MLSLPAMIIPPVQGNGVTSEPLPCHGPVGEKGRAQGGPPSITHWLHKKPTHTSQQAHVLHVLPYCVFSTSQERNTSALATGGILWPVNSWPLGTAGGPPQTIQTIWSKETSGEMEKEKNVVWTIPHE